MRRLFLFTVEHAAFSPQEAARSVQKLDDATFWASDAQVEIMRVLVGRAMFNTADREMIEARLRHGPPRTQYPDDAFKDEEEWVSIWDSSVYRRLGRIKSAGGTLDDESEKVLVAIAARHPKWRPAAGDRDDFRAWHETRFGRDGHPELLAEIADNRLVKEAMRLQREQYFEEGDVWRVFCSADPERALRGLKLEADDGRWDAEAWRWLLWAASEKGDTDFQLAIADLLLKMPQTPLRELLAPAASWLQPRRALVSTGDRSGGARFLPLWDRLADLTYGCVDDAAVERGDDDLLTESLNSPGGV
jgi:hypothetical protein